MHQRVEEHLRVAARGLHGVAHELRQRVQRVQLLERYGPGDSLLQGGHGRRALTAHGAGQHVQVTARLVHLLGGAVGQRQRQHASGVVERAGRTGLGGANQHGENIAATG